MTGLQLPWPLLTQTAARSLNAVHVGILTGALAGNPFGVDRQFIARELGFIGGVCPNSMDAVSDRCGRMIWPASLWCPLQHCTVAAGSCCPARQPRCALPGQSCRFPCFAPATYSTVPVQPNALSAAYQALDALVRAVHVLTRVLLIWRAGTTCWRRCSLWRCT